MTGENTAAPRPSLAYDPPSTPEQAFVNTALLSYRFSPGLELAAGRDQLPTGINIPDLSYFIRARNRLGYYDKAHPGEASFWWTKRYLITPYAYAPGGNEKTGQHESGEGLLAEMDLVGKGRTVLGFNALHGAAYSENRTMVGPYARLGFGRWGILAEHDFVNRDIKVPTVANFNQQASYGQLFWAAREWLVPSLIVERIQVNAPYREHLDAIRLDLTARVAGQVTVSAGPRIQKDEITGRISKSVVDPDRSKDCPLTASNLHEKPPAASTNSTPERLPARSHRSTLAVQARCDASADQASTALRSWYAEPAQSQTIRPRRALASFTRARFWRTLAIICA